MIFELLVLSKLYSRQPENENKINQSRQYPGIEIEVSTFWTRYENDTTRKIPQKSLVDILQIKNIKDKSIELYSGTIIEVEETEEEMVELIKNRVKYLNLARF